MAHIQHLDDLVREYLLFRGFTITLKSFDAELKVDKDRGFRVDRIVDQFVLFINNHDLQSLRDLWVHFDQKIFSKLEYEFLPGVRKLESSVLKFYLASAVTSNKHDKVVEFFTKMTPDLQGMPEWKDWFILPYVKNPEDHPVFSVHFTKQWQDACLVSLHNFLAIVYQVMPQPILASYEEEATKLRRLQEENETLKHKLAAFGQTSNNVPDTVPPVDIMDDFYIIAQENPSSGGESQGKTFKNFIKTIGGGLQTSPIMGRKPHHQEEQIGIHRHHASKRNHFTQTSMIKYNVSVDAVPKRSLSLDSRPRKGQRDTSCEVERRHSKKDNFLLLSQEQMPDHKAAVTHCKFNSTGSLIASCDSNGVLKVWAHSPIPNVLYSCQYKTPITALCWVAKNERFFISGSSKGTLRLHDAKENKIIWEVTPDDNSPLKDSRIVSLCCSQAEKVIACTAIDGKNQAKLLTFDIKTHKLEKSYTLGEGGPELTASCGIFNHNGSLLIAGCSDGTVRIIDVRNGDLLETRTAHDGPIAAIDITQDHNTFYTLGSDHKLCRHNLVHHANEPNWCAALPNCYGHHSNQSFSLHQNGKHVLTACGESGTRIYQISNSGLQLMLHLRGHKTLLTACDWSSANECATCLSASSDGVIIISTILTS